MEPQNIQFSSIENFLKTNEKAKTIKEDDKKQLASIFNECDTDKNGLDQNESKSFLTAIKEKFGDLENELKLYFMTHIKPQSQSHVEHPDNTRVEKTVPASVAELNSGKEVKLKRTDTKTTNTKTVDVKAEIIKEAKAHETNLTEKEAAEWNKVITEAANKYNIPVEILIVIIGRECHFRDPHLNKGVLKNNNGCMQVIPSTRKNIEKDRWGIYQKVNSELRNDIIQSLLKSDLTDRSTGIKAGILVFQTNYAQAVAKIKGYKVGKQPDIVKAADGLKNGTIELTPAEQKEAMRIALRDYNGSDKKDEYAAFCMERLETLNYDFSTPIFSKNNATK